MSQLEDHVVIDISHKSFISYFGMRIFVVSLQNLAALPTICVIDQTFYRQSFEKIPELITGKINFVTGKINSAT